MKSPLGKNLGGEGYDDEGEVTKVDGKAHKISGVYAKDRFKPEIDAVKKQQAEELAASSQALRDDSDDLDIEVTVEEQQDAVAVSVHRVIADDKTIADIKRAAPSNEIIPDRIIDVVEPRGRLETLMDPFMARVKLRNAGVDDDLSVPVNRKTLEALIAERVAKRKKDIDAVNGRYPINVSQTHGDFANEWWDSSDAVERLWGQLNIGVRVVPLWRYQKDIEDVLGEKIEDLMPGAIKQKVYNKLLQRGFNGKRYTQDDLDSIIARKPATVRPTK